MIRKVTLEVPVHLRKFYMHEYGGIEVEKNKRVEYVIQAEKHTELGNLIHLVCRHIPYNQPERKIEGSCLSIMYSTREKAYEIPNDKIGHIKRALDEIFRRTLICEVRSVHELCGGDYRPHIKQFLQRRGIEEDIDINLDTARKIYRDYISRVDKKNRKIYA